MRFQVKELFLPVVMTCCALTISYMTVCRAISDNRQLYGKQETSELPVSQQTALGNHPTYLGNPEAPYTLIQFADYQCPPCRNASRNLPAMVNSYSGKLRLTFRNLPLAEIHKQAELAATAAELARTQGKFWPVHDALYEHQNDLNLTTIQRILHAQNINPKRLGLTASASAQEIVKQDSAFADSIGLVSTPAYLLCCPDGKVLHLATLDQLPRYVRK